MRKLITSTFFALSFFLAPDSFAQNSPVLEIGSVKSILNDLEARNTRESLRFIAKTNSAEQINISLEDYYFKDGQLSMSGEVEGNKNSIFLFKGNTKELYGYVAFHNSQKAFEYTTNSNGNVVVSEVPISHVISDLYDVEMERPASEFNGPRAKNALDYSPMALRQEPHVGKYDNQKINELESMPGCKYVFYMDITRVMNGETPKHMSKEEMYKNWQCVADQYSMFQLNVTTSPSVYQAAGVPNSGIARFIDSDGRSNAPVNSFGTTRFSSNYRKPEGYGYGRTSAHEIGHQMGLYHDGGQPGGEYYEGIPEFQWCPIMGNYWFGNRWDQALYQYSKGEYANANQKQDDLAIMKRHVPFREDDIATSKAIKIGADGTVSPKENFGRIETNTDSDAFDFEIGIDTKSAGHIKLKLDAIEFISMLDIDAEIKKADGTSVAKSNLNVNRSATFDLDLAPGKYQLIIKGGAEGTPRKGFSTYSSMGLYAMEGKITGAVVSGIDKTFLENSTVIYPVPANDIINIDMPNDVNLESVQITSTLGKVVYSSNDNNRAIKVGKLPNGIYFMRINANGESIVKKFSKK